MVGHFKQLHNKSQEQILVAVAKYTYLCVQTVIVNITDQQLLWNSVV